MDDAERSGLIKRYRTGAEVFAAAVAEVDDARLDARTGPDDWTPRQIVHHLADAELRATVRLRQLLAEEEPLIQGYDEELYANRLPLDRSIPVAIEAIRISRESNLELLDRLSPTDWTRAGTHTESGSYSIEDWLRIYTSHPLDHADQLRRAAG